MNWTRGLARIYIVVWVLLAALALVYAVPPLLKDWGQIAHVRAFLKEHPHLKAEDLIPDGFMPGRIAERASVVQDSIYAQSRRADDWLPEGSKAVPAPETIKAVEAAGVFRQRGGPYGHTVVFALVWVIGFVVFPGVLLLTLRWIIAGFEHKAEV